MLSGNAYIEAVTDADELHPGRSHVTGSWARWVARGGIYGDDASTDLI